MQAKFRGSSVFSYALLNSCVDFSKDYTFDETLNSDEFPFISEDGDIYIPLSSTYDHESKRTAIKKPSDNMCLISPSDFTSLYLEDGILTLPYTKDMFLPTLLKDILSNKGTYGVLIKKGNYIINPGHPLVAFLISTGMLTLPEEGDIHIFNWSTKVENYRLTGPRRKFYNEFYVDCFNDIENIVKKATTRKVKASISQSTIENLLDDPVLSSKNIPVKVKTEEIGASTTGIKSLMLPLQMLASGIVTPYYGVAMITDPTRENLITGYHVTPMFSGNIGMDHDDLFRSIYHETDNVCTDSYPRYSSSGWLTLSRVTTDNMYYEEIIMEKEVWHFAQASKNIAVEIWSDIEKEELDKITEAA